MNLLDVKSDKPYL